MLMHWVTLSSLQSTNYFFTWKKLPVHLQQIAKITYLLSIDFIYVLDFKQFLHSNVFTFINAFLGCVCAFTVLWTVLQSLVDSNLNFRIQLSEFLFLLTLRQHFSDSIDNLLINLLYVECYRGNGTNYMGSLAHTRFGLTCSMWDENIQDLRRYVQNQLQ